MSEKPRTEPVGDPIAKVNDEVAVGADLEFQRRWWAFEKIVWAVFTALIILDVAGLFGRGPLARAHLRTADGTVQVDYDRIARYQTPTTLTIHFAPSAVRQGKIQLWVSDSMIRQLGTQRVVPQPATSTLDHDGILYTFPSARVADSVEFALQPKHPGIFRFGLRFRDTALLTAKVLVMP